MGGPGSGRNQRIELGSEGGIAAIDAAPVPLTAEQVLKAVSGYATGALAVPTNRLQALYKLGEAYGLWGAGRKPLDRGQSSKPALGVEIAEPDTKPT